VLSVEGDCLCGKHGTGVLRGGGEHGADGFRDEQRPREPEMGSDRRIHRA
jgi:hypothetical protein